MSFTNPADNSSLSSSVMRTQLDIAMPTGVVADYFGSTAPTGWLLCTGGTIGSGSSGGTLRANADTEDLYTLLWNSIANAELAIQDSSGTPTSRGVSAAADFAANKRLPVPDLRGRIGVGKDNMGGSSANVITDTEADTLADTGGEEDHTLTASEMPSHTHTVTIYPGTGGAAVPMQTSQGGSSNTATTSSAGSGSAHNNVQPLYDSK